MSQTGESTRYSPDQRTSDGEATSCGTPMPQPCYTEYAFDWHLKRIGWEKGADFIEALREGVAEAIPEQLTRVALIDTGVAIDHPYLRCNVEPHRSIDFGSHPHGLAYCQTGGDEYLNIDLNLLKKLHLSTKTEKFLTRFIKAIHGKEIKRPDRDTLHRTFPAHGTACAGLVAAFPEHLCRIKTGPESSKRETSSYDPEPREHPFAAYSGVDPDSKLMAVNTSLDPSPEQLITAFLYCLQNKADVILIPRGIAAEWQYDGRHKDEGSDGAAPTGAWKVLEDLIVAVSSIVPVVCAAGNSGEASLSYPAALSARGENGVIAVGAATYKGFRSSYSNYGDGLTLVAPSDDAEILNRHQVRLDECSRQFKLHQYSSYLGNPETEVEYSHQSIVALDVPASAGYAGGNQSGVDEEDPASEWFDLTRGAFCLFGGTSAAASIVAGVAARLSRWAKNHGRDLSGPDIKLILAETSVLKRPKDQEEPDWELTPDNINGDFDQTTSKQERIELLFGHGHVWLKGALDYIAKPGPAEARLNGQDPEVQDHVDEGSPK